METERRFVVIEWDASILGGLEFDQLEQGYLLTQPDRSASYRLSKTQQRAWFRPKIGYGITRDDSQEEEISPSEARRMLGLACRDRLEKYRYHVPRQGEEYRFWDVDVYQGTLHGLVVVEPELESPDEPVVKPAWVRKWVEVTGVVENQDLARLATEMRLLDRTRSVQEYVLEMIPKPAIGIAGGPCSGKSKALTLLQAMPDIHTVKEIASIFIGDMRIPPPLHDRLANRQFQQAIYDVQCTFEAEASRHAHREGKRLLAMDRGTLEGAAYLEGGIEEFVSLIGTTVPHEHARYRVILFLEMPPETVYEAKRHNNGARYEDYAQARARSERIRTVWCGHPRFVSIPATDGFEEKFERIMAIVRGELEALA